MSHLAIHENQLSSDDIDSDASIISLNNTNDNLENRTSRPNQLHHSDTSTSSYIPNSSSSDSSLVNIVNNQNNATTQTNNRLLREPNSVTLSEYPLESSGNMTFSQSSNRIRKDSSDSEYDNMDTSKAEKEKLQEVINSRIDDDTEEECCICLELLLGEICILGCGHQYHFDCMTKWINKKNAGCPYI